MFSADDSKRLTSIIQQSTGHCFQFTHFLEFSIVIIKPIEGRAEQIKEIQSDALTNDCVSTSKGGRFQCLVQFSACPQAVRIGRGGTQH